MPAEADHLLRCLLEQDNDNAILLLDSSGVIVSWLAAAETIFGYTRDEAVGRPVSLIFTPEDVAAGVPGHELDVARSKGRAEDDRWLLRKDTGRFWAHGTSLALHDEARRIVGFGKVLRDRTEVRTQVEALQNDLRACNQANERKDGFINRLAHELRNPLSVIATCAASLQVRTPEPASGLISSIADQGRFMARMIQDLQDSMRVSANVAELKCQDVVLQEVLIRAADAVRPHAQQRRQSLHVKLLPVAVRAHVDPDRIRQSVINLLENGVKYTPEGGNIWLKFSTEGNEAVIRVEDDGLGIDNEALPELFDLFTSPRRNAAASDHLGAGLGLGLPLVKELVALHGGTVQVRSPGLGKGAEFVVRLPLPDD